MNEAIEAGGDGWRERPWVMAGVGAAGGLLVHILTDGLSYAPVPAPTTVLRQAAAAGVAIATITFLITADRKRIGWAAAFAVAWGLIMGLVGYSTGAYNRGGELVEFPFLSGLLAIAIASPLFQTLRDEGRRSLPYARVHRYAWTDAIIGGASLAFTGLTFLLAFLLGALFDAIGIPLLKDLIGEGWFAWMLAGAAFGAASAVLREKDPLLGTLQRLVMLVFSVLAPVLAGALAIYLIALPTTGFAGLWKSGLPETPLLLSTAAFAVVFLNASIGDSPDDRSGGRLWRVTEAVLLFAVLPLGALALVSMGMRVNQYGWTPERLWGVIACLVAIAYGIAAWVAGIRGRGAFDVPLRESQKWLAVGLCGLALFLALPIVDFGSISAKSQLARLQEGKVKASEFDWAAMAFDFGPSGREALKRIARTGPADRRDLASESLKSDNRWAVARQADIVEYQVGIDKRVRLLSPDIHWTEELKRRVSERGGCSDGMQCALIRVSPDRLVLLSSSGPETYLSATIVDLTEPSSGVREGGDYVMTPSPAVAVSATDNVKADLSKAKVEVREEAVQRVYVDGKPVGPAVPINR
jgi:hypothetical protein